MLSDEQILRWAASVQKLKLVAEKYSHVGRLPRRNRKMALGFYTNSDGKPDVRYKGLSVGTLVFKSNSVAVQVSTDARIRKALVCDLAGELDWSLFYRAVYYHQNSLNALVDGMLEAQVEAQVLFELEEGWRTDGRKQPGARYIQPAKIAGKFWFQLPTPFSVSKGTTGQYQGHLDILARVGKGRNEIGVIEIKAPQSAEVVASLAQATQYAIQLRRALGRGGPVVKEDLRKILAYGEKLPNNWWAIALVHEKHRSHEARLMAEAKKHLVAEEPLILRVGYYSIQNDRVHLPEQIVLGS